MKVFSETFKFGRFLLLAGAVSFSITSCNTDEPETPVDPASNPPTPTFGVGYGVLAAVQTVTTIDPGYGLPIQEIVLGLGSGGFTDATDFSNLIDGGTVTLEGEELTRTDENSYYSPISQTNPTGIEFNGNPTWEVSGSGSVPAFTHTTSIDFPTLGDITSSTTIPGTGAYLLRVANVSGADSVYYMLGGVVHIEPGTATFSVFLESEIDGMGTGATYAQVAPYRFEVANKSGKDFYFVTETVKTQSVTIE
ncbi:MAG: hypothetical protein KBF73_04640 [Flavobacteriales bacterium]|nr:hypothetical protein [Flavobacteriales bacterium]